MAAFWDSRSSRFSSLIVGPRNSRLLMAATQNLQ